MTIHHKIAGLLAIGTLFASGLAIAQSTFTFVNATVANMTLSSFDKKNGVLVMSGECKGANRFHPTKRKRTCPTSLPNDVTVTYLKVTTTYSNAVLHANISSNDGFVNSTVHCSENRLPPYCPYGCNPKINCKISL